MRTPSEPGKYLDRVVLLFLFAVFLLSPPLLRWWSSPGSGWLLPYVLWLSIIILAAWLQHRRDAR